MSSVTPQPLWSVIRNIPTVDPRDLLAAIEAEREAGDHDTRTRVLIRDGLRGLARYWGEGALSKRISPELSALRHQVELEDFGNRGFEILSRQIMDRTSPEDIAAFFTELGRLTRTPTKLVVGGSTSLILRDLLRRATEDVDAVDEIPASIRNQHEALNRLIERYRLRLTHFQSHYLPKGWERRISSFGGFGQLTIFLVDPIDLVVGKIFSRRTKDLDDCRMLKRQLDWTAVTDRIQTAAGPLRADARSLQAAEENWQVLTGDPLPPARGETV